MDNSNNTTAVVADNTTDNTNKEPITDTEIDNFFKEGDLKGEETPAIQTQPKESNNVTVNSDNSTQELTEDEINYFVNLLNQAKETQNSNYSQKNIELNNAQVLLKNMQEVSNNIQAEDINLETIALQTKLDVEAMKLENEILKNKQAWNEVESKYPDIKDNVELDNMIYAYYKEQRQRGNRISPIQAADTIMQFVNSMMDKKASDIQKKAEEELQKRVFGSVKTNIGNTFSNDILGRIKQGDEEAINDFFKSI